MRYEPTWTSLCRQRPARWFLDAKFGIYTHWGPYSVPAYGTNGSWYPHDMYVGRKPGDPQYADTKEHHARTWGPPSEFGYKDFIPLFKAEKFDPDEWADLFERAGARYAGPVAEHHDGFSMWPSRLSRWNAGAMGPKRDVVGELERAIRARGMRFAATFHHAFNWWYYPTWDGTTDCADPEYSGLYSRPHARDEKPDDEYLERWYGKLVEVVEGYRPDLVWFDFGLGMLPESWRMRFLAYYYNKQAEWGREVVVTYKPSRSGADLPPGCGMVDFEMGRLNTMATMTLPDGTVLDGTAAEEYARRVLDDARRRNLIPGGKSLSGAGQHSPTVQVRVPVDLRRRLEERAAAEGVSLSRLAREALERYLAS